LEDCIPSNKSWRCEEGGKYEGEDEGDIWEMVRVAICRSFISLTRHLQQIQGDVLALSLSLILESAAQQQLATNNSPAHRISNLPMQRASAYTPRFKENATVLAVVNSNNCIAPSHKLLRIHLPHPEVSSSFTQ